MGRGIRILLKCSNCKKLVYHTSYCDIARNFVCRRCANMFLTNGRPTKSEIISKWKAYWGPKKLTSS